MTAYGRSDDPIAERARAGVFPSSWIVLADRPSSLGPVAGDPSWVRLVGDPHAPVWTDDYSSLLGVVRWR